MTPQQPLQPEESPRPWRMVRTEALSRAEIPCDVVDADGRRIVRGLSEADALLIVRACNAWSRSTADHIVRALNSYEALVTALSLGVSETEDYIRRNNLCAENNQWLVMARAALAAATEGR